MEKITSFRQKVLDIVKSIPRGEVWTYQKVAELAGSKGASRAVGTILSKNYDVQIPCHRVMRKDGGLGGYNRGIERKKQLLAEEKAVLKA